VARLDHGASVMCVYIFPHLGIEQWHALEIDRPWPLPIRGRPPTGKRLQLLFRPPFRPDTL
jgi:hypothetical protein